MSHRGARSSPLTPPGGGGVWKMSLNAPPPWQTLIPRPCAKPPRQTFLPSTQTEEGVRGPSWSKAQQFAVQGIEGERLPGASMSRTGGGGRDGEGEGTFRKGVGGAEGTEWEGVGCTLQEVGEQEAPEAKRMISSHETAPWRKSHAAEVPSCAGVCSTPQSAPQTAPLPRRSHRTHTWPNGK